MDIERTRTVTSRAVKYPALHADCERVDVPARWLTLTTVAGSDKIGSVLHSNGVRMISFAVCIHLRSRES